MTINEIIKSYNNEYKDIDVYRWAGKKHSIHTDNIESVEDYTGTEDVAEYRLMGKDDYSSTVLANSSVSWADIYSDEDKVLVIVIK